MSWSYNSDSGSINETNDIVAAPELHLGLGWHGPFPTKQAALDYYQQNKAANPGWKAPTGLGGTITNTLPDAVTKPITDVTGAVTGAANTVVKLVPRVLEAAAGIVLLAIALNAVLKQTTGVDVAGTAARGAKKAAGTAAKAAVVA